MASLRQVHMKHLLALNECGQRSPSQSLAARLAKHFNKEIAETQIMVGSVVPATDNC